MCHFSALYIHISAEIYATENLSVVYSLKVFLCCRDYAEKLVASLAHQIQSKYYGVNRYVSFEGIALEHFSSNKQP